MLASNQIYLDLNEMMLPFDGLLRLLEGGYDLFFFSSHRSFLEPKLASFSDFLKEKLGSKKASSLWEIQVFSFEKKVPPRGTFVFKRINNFLIEMSLGSKRQLFCIIPRSKNRGEGSLIAECPLAEESDNIHFESIAKIFFDEILIPAEENLESFFLALMLHRLILWEIDYLSRSFKESHETILGPLKEKGFFISLSKKNSRLLKSHIAEEDLLRWLFDYFQISPASRMESPSFQDMSFNKEYVYLRTQVYLCLLMFLLVKKGAFSSFIESEVYVRSVLFIEDKAQSFQTFFSELGEDKFNFLVWQFFPEYLDLVSFYVRSCDDTLQR